MGADVCDMGGVKSFVGMKVVQDRAAGTISLSSPRHINDLIKDSDMWDCKPNHTPMVPGCELGGGEPLPDGNRFAELVGSLMYISNQTRPDIAFAVGQLA